jgi:hypothetical protein
MFKKIIFMAFGGLFCTLVQSLEPSVNMQVWINQAIINTYTFNDKNMQERQEDMAKDFTAEAWKAYLTSLKDTNIVAQVTKNHYQVSAVATLPPEITPAPDGQTWAASMPILVKYKNDDQVQTQNLDITLQIVMQDDHFAIQQYQAKVLDKPCLCQQAYYPKVTIA